LRAENFGARFSTTPRALHQGVNPLSQFSHQVAFFHAFFLRGNSDRCYDFVFFNEPCNEAVTPPQLQLNV
jgi:hypothetical protein